MPTIKSEKILHKIYDILEEECGAIGYWRENFVYSFLESDYPPHEYRFRGNLGFGGKFWFANNEFYVSCYKEDENPVRLETIKKANDRLSVIKKIYDSLRMS